MYPITVAITKKRPRHYTGINKSCMFIIRLLMKKAKLTECKVLLTLRKIRLNEEFQTLADLFDINRRTAGKYFNSSVKIIAKLLHKFLKYMKPQSIKRKMPLGFRRNYNQIGLILDCFEIQIEKLSLASKQSKSYSKYKSCNTVKYLACITPDGLFCYVSRGFGGRTSDMAIITCSKLKKTFRAKVLADRGFKGIESYLI